MNKDEIDIYNEIKSIMNEYDFVWGYTYSKEIGDVVMYGCYERKKNELINTMNNTGGGE